MGMKRNPRLKGNNIDRGCLRTFRPKIKGVTNDGEIKIKISGASQFILLVKYYQGDEISGACSMHEGDIKSYKYLAIKPEAKRSFKRPRHRRG